MPNHRQKLQGIQHNQLFDDDSIQGMFFEAVTLEQCSLVRTEFNHCSGSYLSFKDCTIRDPSFRSCGDWDHISLINTTVEKVDSIYLTIEEPDWSVNCSTPRCRTRLRMQFVQSTRLGSKTHESIFLSGVFDVHNQLRRSTHKCNHRVIFSNQFLAICEKNSPNDIRRLYQTPSATSHATCVESSDY